MHKEQPTKIEHLIMINSQLTRNIGNFLSLIDFLKRPTAKVSCLRMRNLKLSHQD